MNAIRALFITRFLHSFLLFIMIIGTLWGCASSQQTESTSVQISQQTRQLSPTPQQTESTNAQLSKEEQTRQHWKTYEQELRSWCAQTSPNVVEEVCIHDALVKRGLSPTVFLDMETMAFKVAYN